MKKESSTSLKKYLEMDILKKVLKFIWAFLTVPYHEGKR